jgi:hypothetical protein
MKKTAVLLYPNYSEYELSVALSILMQAEKPVVTVAGSREPIRGEAGLVCLPDATVNDINPEEIDSLLLTGCLDIFALNDGEVIPSLNYSACSKRRYDHWQHIKLSLPFNKSRSIKRAKRHCWEVRRQS